MMNTEPDMGSRCSFNYKKVLILLVKEKGQARYRYFWTRLSSENLKLS